jgi:hypothetical protein
LERVLTALPVNEQGDQQIVTLSQDVGRTYRVVRVGEGTANGAGFAAIGGAAIDETVPETLISDIGHALAEAPEC